MEIYLDVNSEVPLYQQIRNQVMLGVLAGSLKEGEPLPSTRQLAADLGINFHTVNKAYDILRQEGILRLTRKRGAVVVLTSATEEFLMQWRENVRILMAEARVKGVNSDVILAECRAILEGFRASG